MALTAYYKQKTGFTWDCLLPTTISSGSHLDDDMDSGQVEDSYNAPVYAWMDGKTKPALAVNLAATAVFLIPGTVVDRGLLLLEHGIYKLGGETESFKEFKGANPFWAGIKALYQRLRA
jgi:hypothetical protein